MRDLISILPEGKRSVFASILPSSLRSRLDQASAHERLRSVTGNQQERMFTPTRSSTVQGSTPSITR